MARATMQSRWNALREMRLAEVGSPEYCRVYSKIAEAMTPEVGKLEAVLMQPLRNKLVNEIGVTSSEAMQFNAMMWARWLDREQGILMIDDLTPGQRYQFDAATLNSHQAGAPYRLWYEANKPHLNPDVVRYMDEPLTQTGRRAS